MAERPSTPGQRSPAGIDTSVPHSARIWNYWLGGKDNYEVDRAAGEAYRELVPEVDTLARASRYFLVRTIRYLAGEAGIRQFLDVGTGLPTVDNTHQVAQRVAPDSRVVYVDNDPLVLVHAHALLTSTPQGATDYIEADLHDPAAVLAGAARTLDLRQPVALILSDVLGHVGDDATAHAVVRDLVAGLAPGSHLMLSHGCARDAAVIEAQQQYNESGAVPYVLRTPERIARFFDGLDLVEPGVVPVPEWRPDAEGWTATPSGVAEGGVARVP